MSRSSRQSFRPYLCVLGALAINAGACTGGAKKGAAEDPANAKPNPEGDAEDDAEGGAKGDSEGHGEADDGRMLPAPTSAAPPEPPPERFGEVDYELMEGDDDAIKVDADEPYGAGIGYEISGLAGQGWTRHMGGEGQFMLSGPPGGPLGFEIRGFPSGLLEQDLEEVFEGFTGEPAAAKSPEMTLTFAQGPRQARAFRTGESLATTGYCVIRIPSGKPSKGGLWAMFHVGVGEDETPNCNEILAHPRLATIEKNFKLVE